MPPLVIVTLPFLPIKPRLARGFAFLCAMLYKQGVYAAATRPTPFVTLRRLIMKTWFCVCCLLLCAALPAWADEEEDIFIDTCVVVIPNAENSMNEDMPDTVKELAGRIRQKSVLGKAADKVRVLTAADFTLEFGFVSAETYPRFQQYRDDVRKMYKELVEIKKSRAFLDRGLQSREGRAWQKKLDALLPKYKAEDLPHLLNSGLTDLNLLAMLYSQLRLRQIKDVLQWEEMSANCLMRLGRIINMSVL